MVDYYKLFGLDRNCSIDELDKRFNEKMLSLDSDDIISYTFWATKARKEIRRYNYGSKKITRQNVLCRF